MSYAYFANMLSEVDPAKAKMCREKYLHEDGYYCVLGWCLRSTTDAVRLKIAANTMRIRNLARAFIDVEREMLDLGISIDEAACLQWLCDAFDGTPEERFVFVKEVAMRLTDESRFDRELRRARAL